MKTIIYVLLFLFALCVASCYYKNKEADVLVNHKTSYSTTQVAFLLGDSLIETDDYLRLFSDGVVQIKGASIGKDNVLMYFGNNFDKYCAVYELYLTENK